MNPYEQGGPPNPGMPQQGADPRQQHMRRQLAMSMMMPQQGQQQQGGLGAMMPIIQAMMMRGQGGQPQMPQQPMYTGQPVA